MKKDSGQVMLITVLALGGMLLGATAIGGLLMTYQIRQSSDITNSTKAIMAADAGIEWALYNLNCGGDPATPRSASLPTFDNGATVAVTIDGSCSGVSVNIQSVGKSSQIYRALEMTLASTPPVIP